MKGPIAIVVVVGFAGGCTFGMTQERFRPARTPWGIDTRVRTSVGEFAGELIEIRKTGLVLLTDKVITLATNGATETRERRLRLIPYAAVLGSRFEQLNRRVYITGGRKPPDDRLEELRLVSRFPHGLSSEVMAQLLEAYGQTELAGIQP